MSHKLEVAFVQGTAFISKAISTVSKKINRDDYKGSFNPSHVLLILDDDIKNFARRMTRIQFAQYGMTGMPDDILDNYAKNMLSKDETRRNVIEKTLEDKVFDVIKNNVKVVDTTVSVEEFNKLFE